MTSRVAASRRLVPVAVLALAGAVLPAAAAAACPNDAVRAQQDATALPDCRAYELVSPVDKNGAAIRQVVAPRPGGDGVVFWSTGAFAGAPGSIAGNYTAQRGAGGWTTRALNPPVRGRNPFLMDQPYVDAMSRDFSQALIETRYPVDPDDAFEGDFLSIGLPDLYRADPDGSFTWLSPTATLPDRSGVQVVFGAATADLETVVYRTAKQVSAGGPAGPDEQLYARHGDQVTLLSVAPAGGPLPRGAVLGRNLLALETDSGSTVGGRFPSALSADGATVWFATKADPDDQQLVPQLYVRSDALDPAAAATTQVSRSQAADTLGDDCATPATFLAATQDGATAWFACGSRLTDDAPAGGGLYRYDRAGGQLQLVAATLDGTDVGSQLALIGADRDGDHLWFATGAQLTADAPAGSPGLYHLHDGAVTFVNTLSWLDAITASGISPDGARIAFATDDQLDPDAGGVGQVYSVAADAAGDGPVCISCRADGDAPLGRSDLANAGADAFLDGNSVPRRGNVAADGSVYFASADRLVAADVNETADVYQYRDGQLTLLSSGRDEQPSVFGGASDDGRDVFILTTARLAAQDTDNGAADVYSVRVDGGFAPTTPPPVCGEDCQGPPPPKLAPPAPATATFRGPGDERDRSAPPATPKLAVTAPTARQRTRWAQAGRLTLAVRATHAGVVRAHVSGRVRARTVTVATASKRLARGGSTRLALRLSGAARRQLARSGKLRLTITVIHSQVADPRRVTVTLRAPAATHRNGGRR